jgi:NADPH-dependent 2,4-dienoyl-CoA reductase/sulfur reductase-like enzyme
MPNLPNVAGLEHVPYFTYETLFENDKLPRHLIIAGGGPIGIEMGQAYRRLGSEVTIVARTVLPKQRGTGGSRVDPPCVRTGRDSSRSRPRDFREQESR